MPLEIISDPHKKNPNLQEKTSPLVKVKTTLKNASSPTMKKPQPPTPEKCSIFQNNFQPHWKNYQLP